MNQPSFLHRSSSSRAASCLGLLTALVLCGCTNKAETSKTSPAKVAEIAHEDKLNTIELTPEAEQRLGIECATVEEKNVERLRAYGAEVSLPPGALIAVSAPVSGTLEAASAGGMPTIGTRVQRKQPIFLLTPLAANEQSMLTPAERVRLAESRNTIAQTQIDAEGQVQQARVQVAAAKVALERAERLLRDEAGTARAVDEARAQLSLAQEAHQAASSRKKLVDGIQLEAGDTTPLVIEAPQDGILSAAHATAGEAVNAGAPLFDVGNYDPVWIKVAVYAGELDDIDLTRATQIASLADSSRAGETAREAKPVAAPPTAVALASTVDLYYELANAKNEFRPGERLTARLALKGQTQGLVIPWSAVVHDIYGGSWVYENTAPHIFVRRRVEVRHVANGLAVLAAGPAPGAKIVARGVMELFGTEFGFAK